MVTAQIGSLILYVTLRRSCIDTALRGGRLKRRARLGAAATMAVLTLARSLSALGTPTQVCLAVGGGPAAVPPAHAFAPIATLQHCRCAAE